MKFIDVFDKSGDDKLYELQDVIKSHIFSFVYEDRNIDITGEEIVKLRRWLNGSTLLYEIEVNTKDPNIKKVSKAKWLFQVADITYIFQASPINLKDNTKGFLVEWGVLKDNGSISTEIEGKKTNVIKVFSKVISCMDIFIRQEYPEAFVMYANKRLSRIYDSMWGKFSKQRPFSRYFFRDRKEYKMGNGEELYVYHYYRKPDDYMNEDQWVKVLSKLV